MEPEAAPPPVETQSAERLRHFAAVRRGEEPLGAEEAPLGEVHEGHLVVQGTLSGVGSYLLRPIPAAGAAARRLRARSFRAAALSELLARRVAERLGLARLFCGANTFLLAGPAATGWQESLQALQREFDAWLFQHLQPAGELQFHLAGAVCQGERLPWQELDARLQQRRLQPLEGALRAGLRWNARAFVVPAGPDTGLCSGCGAVASLKTIGEENLCAGCAADGQLSARLPDAPRTWYCPEPEADVPGPGLGLKFSPPDAAAQELQLDAGHWPLVRRLPVADGNSLGFDELAERAAGGKKLLGYLHLELDGAARAVAALEGDPVRTVGLNRLLHCFFGERLRELLESKFPLVFPVLGEGGSLLLIGPWQNTLDAAVELRQDFAAVAGEALTLSAGLAVCATHAGIRMCAQMAAEAAREAKQAGGNRLHALGAMVEWPRAASLVTTARALADWLERRVISASWLKRVVELCADSRNGRQQWRGLLEAAARSPRVKHPARAWAVRLAAGGAGSDRPWIAFLAHYATLAAGA